MIEQVLKTALQKIFDLKKVTFDADVGSHEQECLFVEMEQMHARVADGVMNARVDGKVTLYGQSDKMPFSYVAQMIQKAPNDLTKNFFFHDLERAGVDMNIVKLTVSFTFLFSGQYNPHGDNIESIEILGA